MTISMSEQADAEYEAELHAQPQFSDPTDDRDLLLHPPLWLAEGCFREIELRQGLYLDICKIRLRDRWESALPDAQADWLCFHFHLSGEHQDALTKVGNLEYAL
jgi:hypothetical protein